MNEQTLVREYETVRLHHSEGAATIELARPETLNAWNRQFGIDLLDAVDRIKAITGRVDLIHANDSKDGFDSGRDRHDNFGQGSIDTDELVAVVAAAGAPVVCETPGGVDGQTADITFLREHLPA